MMVRCCFDGCFNNSRRMRIRNGRIIGYYCDKHISYLVMNEDTVNDGLYRGSRWFRIGEFREKNLRDILEREGGEATTERIAYLLGRSINEVSYMAEMENTKIIREDIAK